MEFRTYGVFPLLKLLKKQAGIEPA